MFGLVFVFGRFFSGLVWVVVGGFVVKWLLFVYFCVFMIFCCVFEWLLCCVFVVGYFICG